MQSIENLFLRAVVKLLSIRGKPMAGAGDASSPANTSSRQSQITNFHIKVTSWQLEQIQVGDLFTHA